MPRMEEREGASKACPGPPLWLLMHRGQRARQGNRRVRRGEALPITRHVPRAAQAWARMEEREGALQRADELRNSRMQARTEVVVPASFAAGLGYEAHAPGAPFHSIFSMVRPACLPHPSGHVWLQLWRVSNLAKDAR